MTRAEPSFVEMAQEAAEQQLAAAEIVLMHEEEFDGSEDVTKEEYEAAAAKLAGPFCGCTTCVVREVLAAAWPFMSVHAVEQFLAAWDNPEWKAEFKKGFVAGRNQRQPKASS